MHSPIGQSSLLRARGGRYRPPRLRSNSDVRLSAAAAPSDKKGQDAIGWSGCCAHEGCPPRRALWQRCTARVATIGLTPARPLFLEKIDGTLIKVIARVDDLHLALMFKVLDDLAARRNLLRA